ncbi:MAG: MarR family transcriptional regulator [Desulfotalea sp.]|nr:MAG: MarR family transcriptional regulator [Desulfotalea sp.]
MDTKEDLIKATIRDLLRIAKTYSRIEKLPIPVDDNLEVTTKEAHTIQAIGEYEQINITQLASHFGITKSAASQMVAKLVQKDFLSKRQAAHSNKEFELSLTPLGQKVLLAHEQFHGSDLAGLIDSLSGFSISQIATLSVLLEALGSVMEQRLLPRGKK